MLVASRNKTLFEDGHENRSNRLNAACVMPANGKVNSLLLAPVVVIALSVLSLGTNPVTPYAVGVPTTVPGFEPTESARVAPDASCIRQSPATFARPATYPGKSEETLRSHDTVN